MRTLTVTLVVALGAVAGSAQASDNLLANAGFDTNLAGWTAGTPPSGGSQSRQAVDADGSPASGSFRASVPARPPNGEAYTALQQCVPVEESTTYALSVKARVTDTDAVLPIFARAFPTTDCSGPINGAYGFVSVTLYPKLAKTWESAGGVLTTAIGAHSVLIGLEPANANGGKARVVEFDDAFFGRATATTCTATATRLCLSRSGSDHRFTVRATFSSPSRGVAGDAHAISLESLGVGKGGVMWYFSADNPELLVKVVDGCGITDFFWVYIAAGTDVGTDLTIGDTTTRNQFLFHAPDLNAFPDIQNVYALPCS